MKFILYPSQTRPNKNILSLLKAYEYLLKKRYLRHNLILTGNPFVMPELRDFILDHGLEYSVLWLHGISSQQLAACYKLADLAINPSLAEGGFPFTFTESLSVDTPVVMACANVTEEVIVDKELKRIMLFDPYDWKSMAEKIEWGIANKELLLDFQKPLYNRLAKRTWRHVVNDHITVLDQISSPREQTLCP